MWSIGERIWVILFLVSISKLAWNTFLYTHLKNRTYCGTWSAPGSNQRYFCSQTIFMGSSWNLVTMLNIEISCLPKSYNQLNISSHCWAMPLELSKCVCVGGGGQRYVLSLGQTVFIRSLLTLNLPQHLYFVSVWHSCFSMYIFSFTNFKY
mgnify:CR=1 FL=1